MNCPNCGHEDSFVIKTIDKVSYTYRRRQCKRCKNRFNTKEMISDEWNYKLMYEDVIRKLKRILENEK